MADLLADKTLEWSPVVANNAMNRSRVLTGGNGYSADIGVDPSAALIQRLQSQPEAAWLDLCCGEGRALMAAAERLEGLGLAERVALVGVDLVDYFAPRPAPLPCLRLYVASLHRWTPERRFDQITCVHGLHYIGDKLGLLTRAASWLKPGGRLYANLDPNNLVLADGGDRAQMLRALCDAGFEVDVERRLVTATDRLEAQLPFRYLGAVDAAGPNYTGQPAVDAHYKLRSPAPRRSPAG